MRRGPTYVSSPDGRCGGATEMRVGLALIGLSAVAWAATGVLTPAFPDSGRTLLGAAAYGDWRTDAPGVRRKLTPADMPVPLASSPAANQSHVVARQGGAQPTRPPGCVPN